MSSQKCELLFDTGGGRWVIRFVSLSLCHGRLIAFRWYLPISLPYLDLLRCSMSIPCWRGGPYMFASALPCRYHPIDFFDLSTNLFVLLMFTCDFHDFFQLVDESFFGIMFILVLFIYFLIFYFFCLCFFDFFDLSMSRVPILMYEKILASRLRCCDLCPCRSVLIFLFFFHSLHLSILTFLLLILCCRCPSNICR